MRAGGASRGAVGVVVLAALLSACHLGGHPVVGRGSPCPAGDPLRGVYHPSRLRVLGTCAVYRGVIRGTKPEEDGDYHLYVIPDRPFLRYLDPRSLDYGDLVVEIMPGQRLPIPKPGQTVTFVGTWVHDMDHDWNEFHPVWSERIEGRLFVGLPPLTPEYQGSRSV